MPLTSTSVPTFRSAHGAEKPVASFVRIIRTGPLDGVTVNARFLASQDPSARDAILPRTTTSADGDDACCTSMTSATSAVVPAATRIVPRTCTRCPTARSSYVSKALPCLIDVDPAATSTIWLFTTSRAGGCFAWIVPSSSFFCPAFTRESELMTGTAPPTTITIRTDSPEPTEPASSVTSSPPPLILRTTSPAGTPFSSNEPFAETSDDTSEPTTWISRVPVKAP